MSLVKGEQIAVYLLKETCLVAKTRVILASVEILCLTMMDKEKELSLEKEMEEPSREPETRWEPIFIWMAKGLVTGVTGKKLGGRACLLSLC